MRHKKTMTQAIFNGIVAVFVPLIAKQSEHDMKRGYCRWPTSLTETNRLVRNVCFVSFSQQGMSHGA